MPRRAKYHEDMLQTTYDEDDDIWTASWGDKSGQMGESATEILEEYAILKLGMKMGACPSDYIRKSQ